MGSAHHRGRVFQGEALSAAAPDVRGLPTWLVGAAGLGLLVARVVPDVRTVPVETLLFVAIAAVSLTSPRARERGHLHPVAVVAVGVGAVLLAGLATGSPPPVPAPTLLAVGLDVVAAVAEEAFFRRFLYDRVLRFGPAAAIAISALAFALIHIPLYGASVVWVDLGAGLLFGWQRWASGTWGAPAATHAVANVLVALR